MADLTHSVTKAARICLSCNPTWWRALLQRGVAAGTEHAELRRTIAPHTVLDVGANKGQFALAARSMWPDATIISFEPLPEVSYTYRKVFSGDRKAHLIDGAVGPEAGVFDLHVSAAPDSSSLLEIGPGQTKSFPGTHEVRTLPVRVDRLIHLLSPFRIVRPTLLKLDVQGYELEALRASEEVLAQIDWVYAECSFVSLYRGQALASQIITWLGSHDFTLTGVYNVVSSKIDQRPIQADCLFTNVQARGLEPTTGAA
jgi:FkbM family methyltransferase